MPVMQNIIPTDPLPALGRRYAPDPNDRKFLIPRRSVAAAAVHSRYWTSRGVLDQGATSMCVAFAGGKYLTSSPVMNKLPALPSLYRECQQNDEWPGENYDGTSVRALFKVLKKRGLVTEYQWAFDAETVINHILLKGPVVMGTTWTRDMFMPDEKGYITFTGPNEGGHAWLLIGANRRRRNPDGTRGAVRMINSWGKGWGDEGRAWLTFPTLQKLIEDYGEACVANEIRL